MQNKNTIKSILLLISFGIRHSFGLYLLPISSYLNTGREVFGFASALQVLMIGIGSPIFGIISDKYGSGKASLLGITVVIIGLFWMSNATNSFDVKFIIPFFYGGTTLLLLCFSYRPHLFERENKMILILI